MTDRPTTLHAAVSANLAEQDTKAKADPAGIFRSYFDQRAATLDAAAERAKADPIWFGAQSELDRRRIADWVEFRTNQANSSNPKDAA